MTDSEIIKALECCVNNQHCWLCVLKDREDDCHDILKSALDLINRQRAEIGRLNIDLKAMRGAVNSWKAEVQRICKKEFDNIEIDIEAIKSEAVRKFAKRMKEYYSQFDDYDHIYACRIIDYIDKLVEEMGCNDGRIKHKEKCKINEKVKAINPRIVVHGTLEKPYYEISYYNTNDNQWHIGYSSYDLQTVKEYLENYFEIIETDVEPVKHGRWLINSDGYYPYCSECKCEPDGRKMSKHCPNCGAKMDGKEVQE